MADVRERTGLLQGVLAYGLWGIVAAYWKLLGDVDAVELIAHRALWGLVAFGVIMISAGECRAFTTAMHDLRLVGVMAVSALLLAFNWTVFVGAIASGHLLDASLGYFINPLVSVALGMVVLRERLRRLQWLAIACAAIGVGLLTWRAGRVPWISLVLALTFGLYGLVRKTAKVEALVGSTIETVLLAPVAAIYLAVLGGGAIMTADAPQFVLLAGTGFITAVPLVLFTSAARRLPLSTVGFLQYLAPTGQFLLAVLAYGEPLARDKLIAFGWIWVGLVLFSIDLVRQTRRPATM
jgi:chloramphenicol-sensitive protein RarD